MALLGYLKTLTAENQSGERQIISLRDAGCLENHIFGDYITGKSNYGDRPELPRCLDALRNGDTLVIHELDRLGRSMVKCWFR